MRVTIARFSARDRNSRSGSPKRLALIPRPPVMIASKPTDSATFALRASWTPTAQTVEPASIRCRRNDIAYRLLRRTNKTKGPCWGVLRPPLPVQRKRISKATLRDDRNCLSARNVCVPFRQQRIDRWLYFLHEGVHIL